MNTENQNENTPVSENQENEKKETAAPTAEVKTNTEVPSPSEEKKQPEVKDEAVSTEIQSDSQTSETSDEEASSSESPTAESNDAEAPKTSDGMDQLEEMSTRILEHDAEEEHHKVDYSKLNLDGLLKEAVATNTLTSKEAIKRLKDIKSQTEERLRDEKKTKLNEFIAADNNPDDFVFEKEKEVREQMNQLFQLAKDSLEEEHVRIEGEKKKNLERKRELLKKLEEITASDETMDSLDAVKEIQREWKTIRAIPKENVQELWDAYHFLLDKFYDNHSINIELKELDRKKNLAIKIDLCEKVLKIKEMTSLKRSFILLNKYNEEFRNTGPVPREFNKEIWDKFRQACDTVYQSKKELLELEDQKRNDNLKLKQVLVEKAALVVSKANKTAKDWKHRTKELDELMEDWKKIGQVPKNVNDEIWKAFRVSFNDFYKTKNEFFKTLYKQQKANLILKEDLCKRAEEIQNRTDFADATKELLKLQEEWKAIGPVPDKVSNAVWKRFRKSCDVFFKAKQDHFQTQKSTEVENQKKKEGLIEKITQLADNKDAKREDILKELKEVQAEWRTIGFVPFKAKNSLQKRYNAASDSVYSKFKINKENLKEGQLHEHYASLLQMPNGRQKLLDEDRKLRKKMDFLNGEIDTWETNIQFFARSKNADKLRADIETKVSKAQDQIKRISKEKNMIRRLIKEADTQD